MPLPRDCLSHSYEGSASLAPDYSDLEISLPLALAWALSVVKGIMGITYDSFAPFGRMSLGGTEINQRHRSGSGFCLRPADMHPFPIPLAIRVTSQRFIRSNQTVPVPLLPLD